MCSGPCHTPALSGAGAHLAALDEKVNASLGAGHVTGAPGQTPNAAEPLPKRAKQHPPNRQHRLVRRPRLIEEYSDRRRPCRHGIVVADSVEQAVPRTLRRA